MTLSGGKGHESCLKYIPRLFRGDSGGLWVSLETAPAHVITLMIEEAGNTGMLSQSPGGGQKPVRNFNCSSFNLSKYLLMHKVIHFNYSLNNLFQSPDAGAEVCQR